MPAAAAVTATSACGRRLMGVAPGSVLGGQGGADREVRPAPRSTVHSAPPATRAAKTSLRLFKPSGSCIRGRTSIPCALERWPMAERLYPTGMPKQSPRISPQRTATGRSANAKAVQRRPGPIRSTDQVGSAGEWTWPIRGTSRRSAPAWMSARSPASALRGSLVCPTRTGPAVFRSSLAAAFTCEFETAASTRWMRGPGAQSGSLRPGGSA